MVEHVVYTSCLPDNRSVIVFSWKSVILAKWFSIALFLVVEGYKNYIRHLFDIRWKLHISEIRCWNNNSFGSQYDLFDRGLRPWKRIILSHLFYSFIWSYIDIIFLRLNKFKSPTSYRCMDEANDSTCYGVLTSIRRWWCLYYNNL